MTNQRLREERVIALTVPCRYCGAKQNQPCQRKYDNQPLTHLAAHFTRIRDAQHKTSEDIF